LRTIITGGAGFIGANLARHMLESGVSDDIAVIDDLSTGSAANLAGVDVEFHDGSVLDEDLLHRVLDSADAVVHLAALPSVPRSVATPVAAHEANATGTVRLLEAVRRARSTHTVMASSSSVYGRNETLPKHEGLATEPMSPYAASKLAAEAYAHAYSASYDLDLVVFRFFNVFGPLQHAGHAYAAAIPAFIDAALHRRPLILYGDGKQTRDFTYVGSVCAVIAEALRRRVIARGPVNLAFGGRRSLLEIIGDLEEILGWELDIEHLPMRVGDVRHSQADQTRLRELFPDVQPVDLHDGLRATVNWYRQYLA
jgi:UDP-glucose 4-epimerase